MEIDRIAGILGPGFQAASEAGGRALRELALPAGAAVLDVGTGNGNFAIYLASQGFQVVTGEPGTDESRYARRDWAVNAQKAGVLERIRFESFDAAGMPFDTDSFDAVFFFGVLHHIAEPLRTAVLREALRVTKPGGPVVFFEPGKAMLEKLRIDDPGHPPAANPSNYLGDATVREHRIESPLVDIFLYRKRS